MKDGEMERKKTKMSLHRPFFTSMEGENHHIGITMFVCTCIQDKNPKQYRNTDARTKQSRETSRLLLI